MRNVPPHPHVKSWCSFLTQRQLVSKDAKHCTTHLPTKLRVNLRQGATHQRTTPRAWQDAT